MRAIERGHGAGKENLRLWFCERCGAVHLRAGEVLLSLTPPEFIDFAAAVGDIYGRVALASSSERTPHFEFDLVA